MSLVPCARCAADELEIGRHIRQAEYARAQDRPTALAKSLRSIDKLKADLAFCDHAGMARSHDVTRARHAAARQDGAA